MKNFKSKSRYLVQAALALGMVSTSQSSYAVCDGCVVGAVKASAAAITTAIGTATATISGLMTTQSLLTQQTIKGSATQISQASSENAKAISNTVSRTGYDIARNQQTARYSVTNPCSVIAASSGLSGTLRSAPVAGASVGRGGSSFSGGGTGVRAGSGGASSDLARSIAIAKGAEGAPAPEVTAKLAASGACVSFAAAGSQRAAACQAAQFNPMQSNPFGDADLRAETLFDGPQRTGQPSKKFTVDNQDGSPERVALEAFIRNMGTPLELRALGRGELATDAGRRYLAVKDSYEARMSFAERPMRRQVGMMAPSADSIPVLERMLASQDGQWVQDYLNRAAPNWRARGVSRDEMMNIEVESRYLNRGWQVRTVTMAPEEISREQLRLTALQNALLWQLNQEVRESGILLGGLNATAARSESLPELKAAHAAATR